MFCTKIFEFDAAHRVLNTDTPCRFLHGHRYKAEVTICSDELDKLGMVLDFIKIKEIIGSWINHNLDHNTLLNPDDCLARMVPEEIRELRVSDTMSGTLQLGPDYLDVFGRVPFILEKGNPTAEVLAKVLLEQSEKLLNPYNSRLRVSHVRLWETPTSYSDYRNPFFHPST